MPNRAIRWSREKLDALLDEAAVRGKLSITLASSKEASSLRWALYPRRSGKERLSLSGATLTITVPYEPELNLD